MALIKCTECGNMLSDKAQTCPHCGAPVEHLVKCEDCGTEYAADAAACPTCGCPNHAHESAQQTAESVSPSSQPQYHSAAGSANVSDERKKRVQRFLVENKKFLPQNRFNEIRERLLSLTDDQWSQVEYVKFQDPTMLLILSVVVGEFGVDRFILGDTTNGVLKLLLTLCCGVGLIWWLIDIFQVNGLTLEYNYKQLNEMLTVA